VFDTKVAALRDRYRCIAFDFRGQGQSEPTRTGYDLETVTEDNTALIGALNFAPCHFVGPSMGEVVGMLLVVRGPEFIKSLTLIAACRPGSREEKSDLPVAQPHRALVRCGGTAIEYGG